MPEKSKLQQDLKIKKYITANIQVLNGELFFWNIKIEDKFYFGKDLDAFLNKIAEDSDRNIVCYLWKGSQIAIHLLIKHCCYNSKTYNYVTTTHANKYNEFTFLQNSKNNYYFLEVQKNVNIRFLCIENISPHFSKEFNISDFDWQNLKNEKGELKVTVDDLNFSKHKLCLMEDIIFRKLKFAHTTVHRLSLSNNVYNLWRLSYFPKKKYKLFFENWVDSEEDYLWYRNFIEGGINFFDKSYEGKKIELDMRDASGHYPRIILERILPIRKAQKCKEEGRFCFHKLKLYEIWVAAAKLKPNRIPFVRINNFESSDYPKYFSNAIIYKTNIEWDFIKEHYEITTYTIIREECFRYYEGEKIAGNFLRRFLNLKENAKDKNDRIAVKSYTTIWWGVFITNAIRTRKYLTRVSPVEALTAVSYFETEENDFFIWKNKKEMTSQPKYCPLGIFVASYARIEILKVAIANFERLVYIGIDAIFLLVSPKNDWPKFSGIGEFKKIYGENRTFVTIKDSMRYLVENEKGEVLSLKFSGVNKDKITAAAFKNDTEFNKNIIKKTPQGDVLLIEEKIKFKK